MAPSKKKTPLNDFINPFKSCTLGSPISSSHELTKLLTSPQIDLFIGSDREHIQVPQSVLCLIPFFAKGCEGGFRESKDKAFELPEESPIAVKAIIDWLLRGTSLQQLQGTDEISEMPLLASVLILADKWCIDTLKMACCNLACQLLDHAEVSFDDSGSVNVEKMQMIGDLYKGLEETRYRYIPIYFAVCHSFSPRDNAWMQNTAAANRKGLFATTRNHAFWTELFLWQGIVASSSSSNHSWSGNGLSDFLFLLCSDGLQESTVLAFRSLVDQGCDEGLSQWASDDITAFLASSLSL